MEEDAQDLLVSMEEDAQATEVQYTMGPKAEEVHTKYFQYCGAAAVDDEDSDCSICDVTEAGEPCEGIDPVCPNRCVTIQPPTMSRAAIEENIQKFMTMYSPDGKFSKAYV